MVLRHFCAAAQVGWGSLGAPLSAAGWEQAEDAHAEPRAVGSSSCGKGAAEASEERKRWQGRDGAVVPFVGKSINQRSCTPFGVSSRLEIQLGGGQRRELVALQRDTDTAQLAKVRSRKTLKNSNWMAFPDPVSHLSPPKRR